MYYIIRLIIICAYMRVYSFQPPRNKNWTRAERPVAPPSELNIALAAAACVRVVAPCPCGASLCSALFI